MTLLNDMARELIDSGRLAHLVTLDPDGTPQIAIVWVGVDGDQIVSAHLDPRQKKLQNLRRDPRVALSIETDHVNAHGLQEYLVVHGTSTLQEGGAPELLQHLARRYLGPDVRFPPMDEPPPGIVNRITVEKVTGIGPWFDQP